MKLLTGREMAALLRIHYKTLMRLAVEGKVPSIQIGGVRRFQRDAVLQALGLGTRVSRRTGRNDRGGDV